MYLNFYGLREEPFGVTPDPQFLFLSPSYREAQATLECNIRSGRGFSVLVGNPGIGKTTLLFDLLQRYSGRARTAFIFLTQCNSREFLRYLMSELGMGSLDDFVRMQEQFGRLLAQESRAGRKVIIVVDEGQNLDISVLETVRLLSDFETARAKLLHIILTGQPALASKLASPALLQLRQRICSLVHLKPLTQEELQQYIEHRLRVAGYSGPPLFTPEAHAFIFRRSQGIPRVVNSLCFNALSLGCALGKRTIDMEAMNEVSGDLDLESIVQRHHGQSVVAVQGTPQSHDGSREGKKTGREEAPAPPCPPNGKTSTQTAMAQAVPDHAEPGNERMARPTAAAAGETVGAAVVPYEGQYRHLAPRQPALDINPLRGAALADFGPNINKRNGLTELDSGDQSKEELGASPVERAATPPTKQATRSPIAASNGSSAGTQATAPPRTSVPRNPVPVTPSPRSRQASARGVLASEAYKLRPTHPEATMVGRKRRGQGSFWLALSASLVFVLVLWWLLQASGRSDQAGGSSGPAAQNIRSLSSSVPIQTSPNPSPTDTILDVLGPLPSSGSANFSHSRPVVVMRSNGDTAKLVHRVGPAYPALARAQRLQGQVVLEAVIERDGHLHNVRVMNGQPLLTSAVLDAVRGWRYQPYTVSGRTVERTTRIVVNFRLVAPGSAPNG